MLTALAILGGTAAANDFTSADIFQRALKECGGTFTGEIEADAFKADGLEPKRAIDRCLQPMQALANYCGDHEAFAENAAKLTTVRCVFAEGYAPELSLKGSELIVGLSSKTGNLYSDAYKWYGKMPAVGGGLAPADAEDRKEALGKLAKDRQQIRDQCGVDIPVEVDEKDFLANDMLPDRAISYCGNIVRAVAHVCEIGESNKADLSQYTKIACAYGDVSEVDMELKGAALHARFKRETGNLYSDAYQWLKFAPSPTGGLSAEERKRKDAAQAKLDKTIASIQDSCHAPSPLQVDIDWDSFAPELEGPDVPSMYGHAGVIGFCNATLGLGSICSDRYDPDDSVVRSPADKVKGYRCVYDAGAGEPAVSVSGGIVTVGYNHNTANMHSSNDAVRKAFPK